MAFPLSLSDDMAQPDTYFPDTGSCLFDLSQLSFLQAPLHSNTINKETKIVNAIRASADPTILKLTDPRILKLTPMR